MRAIKAVKPGPALSVVGRVIESYANRFGYNVVRDFTGHGIGTTFHNGLVVLHYDQPAVDDHPRAGHDVHHRADDQPRLAGLRDLGRRLDGGHQGQKWTAQFEHTLVVTDDRRRDPDPAVTFAQLARGR